MAMLGILGFFIVFCLIVIAFAFVEGRGDRPQRIKGRDAKALVADNKRLRDLVNEIDVQANVQMELNPTNVVFPMQINTMIANARKELS